MTARHIDGLRFADMFANVEQLAYDESQWTAENYNQTKARAGVLIALMRIVLDVNRDVPEIPVGDESFTWDSVVQTLQSQGLAIVKIEDSQSGNQPISVDELAGRIAMGEVTDDKEAPPQAT